MNTANLQIEGLLVAMARLCRVLQDRGAITRDALDTALSEAEVSAAAGRDELGHPQREALRFPARFLRQALVGSDALDYRAITAAVAREHGLPEAGNGEGRPGDHQP
jgi:hypothetical protein